jgi:hypothetical protein
MLASITSEPRWRAKENTEEAIQGIDERRKVYLLIDI